MPVALPHVLPYALFVALGALVPYAPPALAPWLDPLRAVLVGGALFVFFRRGAYPELSEVTTAQRGATYWALLAGLSAGLAWVPLAELVPLSFGDRAGFDADRAPLGLWIARLVASVAVVPFAEELCVRSFVPRFVDCGERDWRSLPIGRFTLLSAVISLAVFVSSHPEWLAALAVGVVFTLLLAATRRLRDVVLAHAVANTVLAVWVIATGDTRWW